MLKWVVTIDKKEIIQFFSDFWEISISDINDDLELSDEKLKKNTSLKFYRFIAALESNFDVKITKISNIRTFGDLFKNIAQNK